MYIMSNINNNQIPCFCMELIDSHCHPPTHDKMCWILVILMLPVIGAIIYLIVNRLPKYTRNASDLFPKSQ